MHFMQDSVEAQTANNSVSVFNQIFGELVFVACLFPGFNLAGADAIHNIKEHVNNSNNNLRRQKCDKKGSRKDSKT